MMEEENVGVFDDTSTFFLYIKHKLTWKAE